MAHWIFKDFEEKERSHQYGDLFECSNCGFGFAGIDEYYVPVNFCSNCGEKMDNPEHSEFFESYYYQKQNDYCSWASKHSSWIKGSNAK